MKIILARHGNTFGENDKVVWAGLKEDFPLVKKGREQAEVLGNSLLKSNLKVKKIYSAELKRTRETATIVQEICGIQNIVIDNRLNEIDYGSWGGLSTDEIIARGGKEALELWDKKSIFPVAAGWQPEEAKIIKDITDFYQDLKQQNETVLVVSSNGRLRYFLKLIAGAFEMRVKNQAFKIKTGNVCLLDTEPELRVIFWNEKPEVLCNLHKNIDN